MIVEIDTNTKTLVVGSNFLYLSQEDLEIISQNRSRFVKYVSAKLKGVHWSKVKNLLSGFVFEFCKKNTVPEKSKVLVNSVDRLLTVESITVKLSKKRLMVIERKATEFQSRVRQFVNSVDKVTNNNLLDFVASFK